MSQDGSDSLYYPEPPASGPSQRGCFFYGCLIAVILMLVMLVAIAIGGFFLYRFASRMVGEYTADVPASLPMPTLGDDEVQALKGRIDEFKKAINEGRETTLTLTGEELTALLQSEDELKDRVAFTIENDELKGQVSIPFDFPGMGKRYFNANATFNASLDNGVLMVTVDQAEVKGKPVPEEAMREFRKQNLARDAYSDADRAKFLRRIQSLQIKDGKIEVRTRAQEVDQTPAKEDAPPIAEDAPPAPPEPPKDGPPAPPEPPKDGPPAPPVTTEPTDREPAKAA